MADGEPPMAEDRQDATRRAKADLVDSSIPNFARVGDFLYGGRNNFEADRKAAKALVAAAPVLGTMGPALRAFNRRVLRYLVTQAGVTQFLDIGTGLAMSGTTHEVTQQMDPRCRVAYVDNDPVVLAHARALLRSSPDGATGFVDADLRDPAAILAGARGTLDFSRPVAVLLLSTLVHVHDDAEAADIVAALAGAVPSGSYIAIYHMASDLDPALLEAQRQGNQWPWMRVTLRSHAVIASLVADLDLDPVPPGVVPICDWRPEPDDPRFDAVIPVHGVVARKP